SRGLLKDRRIWDWIHHFIGRIHWADEHYDGVCNRTYPRNRYPESFMSNPATDPPAISDRSHCYLYLRGEFGSTVGHWYRVLGGKFCRSWWLFDSMAVDPSGLCNLYFCWLNLWICACLQG